MRPFVASQSSTFVIRRYLARQPIPRPSQYVVKSSDELRLAPEKFGEIRVYALLG